MATSFRTMVPRPLRPTIQVAKIAAALLRPRRQLFLFSHMRSYSSLIGHILGSNPEINGYSELQISYKNELDIIRATLQVYETNGNKLHGSYIFDKVLHGHLEMGKVVLERPRAVAIFVIRKPVETLRSTVAMSNRRKRPDWKSDLQKVAGYYKRRTSQLVEIAASFSGRTCVFSAERLIDDTDVVLDGLSEFLQLKTSLTSDYQVFSHTGRAAYGDPGDHIKSGRMVLTREQHEDICVPHSLVNDLEEHRQNCLGQLFELCDRRL